MKKILIENDILVVQKGKEIHLQGHIIPENFKKDTLEDLDEEDFDRLFDKNYEESDVVFSVKPDGSIVISNFHDFYQFNCCSLNHSLVLTMISAYETVTGIKKPKLHEIMLNPLNMRTKLFSDVVFTQDVVTRTKDSITGYKVSNYFTFKFKGVPTDGENQLSKYSFFHVELDQINTIEEVVDYYITVNKILAKACFDCKDDLYLSNSQWAQDTAIFIADQFYEII
jgi:hypothetical protein